MYKIYMDDTLLPVTPGELEVKIANQNKTVTLINEGEVNILKRPGLSKITFDALLPNVKYPFAVYENGFQPAGHYLDKLELLKTSLKPFSFKVIRTDHNYSVAARDQELTVSLEEYEIKEDAENHGFDMYVSITLLQYKGYVTKVVTPINSAGSEKKATITENRDTSSKPEPGDYTVKSGDSLWAIAKKYLGSGSRFTEVYELNKGVIEAEAKKHGRASSSNGHWIYPGTVLKIPK